MRCCWSTNSAPPARSATIIRTRLCQSSTSALTLALDWLVEFKLGRDREALSRGESTSVLRNHKAARRSNVSRLEPKLESNHDLPHPMTNAGRAPSPEVDRRGQHGSHDCLAPDRECYAGLLVGI